MKKGKITLILIICFLVILNIALFGFVFILRKQSVEFQSELHVSEQEIIDTANLKNGASILLIDKEEAINNIEQTYANIKVVQIKTVNVCEIVIVLRQRYELYYFTDAGKHYILDEDLKLLRITETEPTDLIKVNTTISINANTKVCNFLGTEEQKETLLNFYKAMYSAAIKSENAQARIDICNLISEIELRDNILLATTSYGVILDIAKPNHELTNKINICFSTINKLISTGDSLLGRTIKIYYNVGSEEYKCHINTIP